MNSWTVWFCSDYEEGQPADDLFWMRKYSTPLASPLPLSLPFYQFVLPYKLRGRWRHLGGLRLSNELLFILRVMPLSEAAASQWGGSSSVILIWSCPSLGENTIGILSAEPRKAGKHPGIHRTVHSKRWPSCKCQGYWGWAQGLFKASSCFLGLELNTTLVK